MDARAKSVREILHSSDQYIIPFFQRSYSWETKQWKRLCEDIEVLLDESSRTQHFLGPLVCTPSRHVPGEVNGYQLIDGQQRLTTLTLLLIALRDVCRGQGFADIAEEIEEDFLIHKRRPGLQRYKIVPRLGDREILTCLIDPKGETSTKDSSLQLGHRFLQQRITKLGLESADQIRQLLSTVTDRLSLVVITITGENPYEIFESLNSTGLPLEESDLIRNYVFMQVPLEQQDDFHREHWAPFENVLTSEANDRQLDPTGFYRNFLMRTGEYSKKRATFVGFKDQSRARQLSPQEQVGELKRFLKYARWIEGLEEPGDVALSRSLSSLRELEVSTATPLMMKLLESWKAGSLPLGDLIGCLDDLASFVMRRSVCELSTRTYGQWFVEAAGIAAQPSRDELQRYYCERGWPADDAFSGSLVRFSLYKREPKKCRLILERLEDSYGHKERVSKEALTVEHVLPQNPSDAAEAEWKATLPQAENWYPVHQQWVHTIGNLTLTGYNRELSNRKFSEKRAALLDSHVSLNRHFGEVPQWGPEEIRARGEQLADKVTSLWPNTAPEAYQPEQATHRTRNTFFDINGLRAAAVARLESHLGLPLEAEGEARFSGLSGELRLVCAGSQPYPKDKATGYWFGVTPEQIDYLRLAKSKYLAFACGSPDRLLLFSLNNFEPLIGALNVTEGRHWHVQISWADSILLDQPKAGRTQDVTGQRL